MGVRLLLLQGDPWFSAPGTVAPLRSPPCSVGVTFFPFYGKEWFKIMSSGQSLASRCSKELNQWEALTEYGQSKGHINPYLVLECAWRVSNWTAMKEALVQVRTHPAPRLTCPRSGYNLCRHRGHFLQSPESLGVSLHLSHVGHLGRWKIAPGK